MSGYVNPHPPGCYWYDAAEKYGAPNLKWCEETLCQVISEPANTWSNLAYVIIFAIMFFMTRKLKSKTLRYTPYAMLIMGLGSMYYHASNNYLTQMFDFIGMFFFVHWLIALNFMRAKIFTLKKAVIVYVAFMLINTLAVHLLYINMTNFQFLIVVAAILILVSEFYARKNNSKPKSSKFLYGALGGIVIAESFSIMDLTRIMCNPTNHVIQGHAIWHALSSIALFSAFLYFSQFDSELE